MIPENVKIIVKKILPVTVSRAIIAYRAPKQNLKIIQTWQNVGRPVPPPHQYKQAVIQYYKSHTNCNVLVETGTYMGDMIAAQKNNFKKLFSIELGEQLWKNAVNRFKKYPHITIMQGDSGKVLEVITKQLDEPAIFWLDGHYSEGITAKGDTDCPIFGEVDAIFKYKKLHHVLLIDDARFFNGKGDYPTIENLTNYISAKDSRYKVEVKDDIIRYTVN